MQHANTAGLPFLVYRRPPPPISHNYNKYKRMHLFILPGTTLDGNVQCTFTA